MILLKTYILLGVLYADYNLIRNTVLAVKNKDCVYMKAPLHVRGICFLIDWIFWILFAKESIKKIGWIFIKGDGND